MAVAAISRKNDMRGRGRVITDKSYLLQRICNLIIASGGKRGEGSRIAIENIEVDITSYAVDASPVAVLPYSPALGIGAALIERA